MKLSPPRFGRRQTESSQSLSVLSRLNGMSCVMETWCSKGSDILVSLRLALLNLVVFQWAVIPGCRWSPRCPLSPFPLRAGFLVGTCFSSCLCFFGIFLFWPVFSPRRVRFSLLDFLGCPHPLSSCWPITLSLSFCATWLSFLDRLLAW